MSTMQQPGPAALAEWRPHGPPGDDETVYFLHIPKAAGTSVRMFLMNQYGIEETLHHPLIYPILEQSPKVLGEKRLILGHHARLIMPLLPRPPLVITMLRDPLARSISHFRHLQARGIVDFSKRKWAKSVGFDEFVADKRGQAELVNYQARHLAVDSPDEMPLYTAKFHGRFDELMEASMSPRLLERAMAVIESAAFVGAVERFDESMALLAHTFSWPEPGPTHSFNKLGVPRVDPAKLKPETIARVRELTQLDQRLHDRVLELLGARLSQMGEVDGPFVERMRRAPRVRRYSLGFEGPLYGKGWMPREKRDDGTVHRWSGPTNSCELYAPLAADQDLVLQFLASAQVRDVIESVRIEVNGEPVRTIIRPAERRDDQSNRRLFRAVLPREVLARNDAFTRIRFETSRAVVAAEEWPGHHDRRPLALRFHWLDIFPSWEWPMRSPGAHGGD